MFEDLTYLYGMTASRAFFQVTHHRAGSKKIGTYRSEDRMPTLFID
jgi:hypothetical protein